jgi:hypothetical protein
MNDDVFSIFEKTKKHRELGVIFIILKYLDSFVFKFKCQYVPVISLFRVENLLLCKNSLNNYWRV